MEEFSLPLGAWDRLRYFIVTFQIFILNQTNENVFLNIAYENEKLPFYLFEMH